MAIADNELTSHGFTPISPNREAGLGSLGVGLDLKISFAGTNSGGFVAVVDMMLASTGDEASKSVTRPDMFVFVDPAALLHVDVAILLGCISFRQFAMS